MPEEKGDIRAEDTEAVAESGIENFPPPAADSSTLTTSRPSCARTPRFPSLSDSAPPAPGPSVLAGLAPSGPWGRGDAEASLVGAPPSGHHPFTAPG